MSKLKNIENKTSVEEETQKAVLLELQKLKKTLGVES